MVDWVVPKVWGEWMCCTVQCLTGGTDHAPERDDVGVGVVHGEGHVGIGGVFRGDNLGGKGMGWR